MKSVFLIITFFCSFQEILSGQVRIMGNFEKDTVEIGSEINFVLSLECDDNVEVLAIPGFFIDSVYSVMQSLRNDADTTDGLSPFVADFELLDIGLWQDLDSDGLFSNSELKWNESKAGGKILYENAFKFRFWDPGSNVIGLPPILYSQDGNQDQYYDPQQVSIFIVPPGGVESLNDTTDLAPIKPILTEKANWRDFTLFIYGLGGVILSVLLLFYYLRRKKKHKLEKIEIPEVFIPAHICALEGLYGLRKEQLWQKGKIKKYQSRLTHIIRRYLEDRYNVAALELTTDEIVLSLQKVLKNKGGIEILKNILQVADLVKFAKAKPGTEIHEEFMNKAIHFINQTKSTEEEE